MDVRRVRSWDWLTGLAGVALLVSLFLPWYSVAGVDATGWESFTVIDVILAVAALAGIALVIVTAAQRTAAVPQALASSMIWLTLLAAVLAVIRLLNLPVDDATREAGVWIGAVSALALFGFNVKAM